MDDKGSANQAKNTATSNSEEVSGFEREVIKMSEQEEDLINRMYKLVGERWDLIAGRIPGRKREEIERFWLTRQSEAFSKKADQHHTK